MQDESSLEKTQASTDNAGEEQKASAAQDALHNIFVDVSANDAANANDEYSDEEEAQFHAQYQEKHFV